jgi:hypothetical protein
LELAIKCISKEVHDVDSHKISALPSETTTNTFPFDFELYSDPLLVGK